MAEPQTVQSLDRAFDLLERLCQSQNGMALGELASAAGLHKSTAHRLLGAMQHRGYVLQDAHSGVYRAGMRLCELSSQILDHLDLVERARVPLEHLARATGETVHLVLREGTDIVYIHKVEGGDSAIRMFSRIGMRRPLYCTGVGKALLATLPNDEVEAVWQESDRRALTARTITSFPAFLRELRRVRREGYALDDEENELGVRCIAVAVCDFRGNAVCALSISAPCARMSDARLAELRPHLLAARDEIRSALG